MPNILLNNQQFERIAKAIGYLYTHHKQQPSLQQLAQALHLSPEHLQRQFTQWVGISPKKLLQYLNVEYAKQQLSQQHSLLHVAGETGLSGTGRLHDLFVQIEGMTPGEFKQGGAGLDINYAYLSSPFGDLLAAATPKGLCHLMFYSQADQALVQLQQGFPAARLVQQSTSTLEQVERLLAGLSVDQPLALHIKGSAFQIKVWQALLKIRSGQLRSYQHIAQDISQPTASRAVASAIASNTIALLIPCHRVIRSTGVIGEYRWQHERKLAVLAWELAHADR
ncbi:methylated-DNA--[protein]-cysteine S-methyltransferase [Pseudomonas sp. F1_0610]|uniref:bifunctional transcriptional activator/DNA repair enzyme AdaA n=1 Tax=Pseudomonas sp. F1_0610 TaxID=3114284 RepID=UPI0039C4961D